MTEGMIVLGLVECIRHITIDWRLCHPFALGVNNISTKMQGLNFPSTAKFL
jgi:hypothetical protein